MPFDPNDYNTAQAPAPQGQASIGDVFGRIMGLAGDALSLPHNAALGALEEAAKVVNPSPQDVERLRAGLANMPGFVPEVLSGTLPNPEQAAQLQQTTPAPTPAGRMGQVAEAVQLPGAAKLALDLGTDPLAYVGLGLPGNAVRSVPLLGQMGRVQQMAKFLDAADTAVAEAPWKLTQKAVGGAFDVLGKTPLPPGLVKITGEGGAKIPAGNLAEWLGSQSASSLYKGKVRNLVDMVNGLMVRGHRLERDMYEQGQFFSAPTAVRDSARNNVALGQMQKSLLQQLSTLKGNPQGQLAGMEVLDRVQQATDTGFRRLAALQQAGAPREEQMAIYNEMFQTITAGRVTLDRIAAHPGAPIDPTMATIVGQQFDNATQRINAENQAGKTLAGALPAWRNAAMTTTAVREAISNFKSNVLAHPWNATPSGTPLIDPSEIADTVTSHMLNAQNQAAAAQRGLPAVAGVLPARLEQTVQQDMPELHHQLTTLITDRKVVGNALEQLWRNVRPGEAYPLPHIQDWTTLDTSTDIYGHINQVLQALGQPPVTAVHEFLDNPLVRSHLSPSMVNRLHDSISHWPGGDILSTDPYGLAIDAVSRKYADQYGQNPQGISKAFREGTAIYKEMSLLSPSYLLTNFLGALSAAGMSGVSPTRSVTHYMENLSDAWHGREVVNSDLRNVLAATGMSLPQSIRSGSGILADINTTKEFLGRGTSSLARVGAVKLGAAGAVLGGASGALTPTDTTQPPAEQTNQQVHNIAKGALEGGALGASYPTLAKYLLTRLSAGMEATVRQDAFMQGFIHSVASRADAIMPMVQAALGERTQLATDSLTNSGARQVVTTSLPQARQAKAAGDITDQIQNFVEGRGGLVSPEWLQQTLNQAGVRAATADKVGSAWRTMLDQASADGQNLAGQIHVDYEHLNNIEDFLKWASPFSTWALKMTPYWAQHIMERPAFLLSLTRLEQAWEADRQKKGLPSRFVGSTEVGPASAVLSAVLGRPVQVYINPMNGFLPYAGSPSFASSASQELETNPAQAMYKMITSFGASPHPLADVLFRVAGAMGQEQPPRGFIRQGDALEPITGVNLNRLGDVAQRSIQGALTGHPVSDFDNMAIAKRVQELAVQQLGHPPTAQDPESTPYLQAIANQSGPIWEQARNDAQAEKGARSFTGLVAQPVQPQTTLSPEEAAIRQAQVVESQGGQRIEFDPQMTKTLQYMTATGHAGEPADPKIASVIVADTARMFGGNVPEPLATYARLGTWGSIEALRKSLTTLQNAGIVKGLQGGPPQINPLMAGYSGGSSPEGDRLTALLAQYNAPGSILTGLQPDQQAAITNAFTNYQYSPAPFAARLAMDKSPSGYWLQQAIGARDAFRKQNPILDEYLSYMANSGGQGNMDDFLTRFYHR